MSGTFVGRIAYASIGFNIPDPEAVIYLQSGDFSGVTADAPDQYTLVFTLAVSQPIPPNQSVYVATYRYDETLAPGIPKDLLCSVGNVTDTSIELFVRQPASQGGPMLFSVMSEQPEPLYFAVDLLVVVAPSV